MINYIIACYFGPRRIIKENYLQDPFYFIKKHVEKINFYNDKNISKVTFVVNPYNENDKKVEEIAENLFYPYEIIYKKNNNNYSYGCWHKAIIKNLNEEYKYFMLIEDDYAPNIENYTDYFLQFFDDSTSCVFQWYTETKEIPIKHAAISNGLIKKETCNMLYSKYNKVFSLNYGDNSNYTFGEHNQVNFLNLFKQENYLIKDISSISKNTFQNINNILLCTGNEMGIDVLHPIL